MVSLESKQNPSAVRSEDASRLSQLLNSPFCRTICIRVHLSQCMSEDHPTFESCRVNAPPCNSTSRRAQAHRLNRRISGVKFGRRNIRTVIKLRSMVNWGITTHDRTISRCFARRKLQQKIPPRQNYVKASQLDEQRAPIIG